MITSKNSFSENLAHVAKLDNSLGTQINLSHDSIVLNADATYSASCTLSLYNRATNITETITVTSSTLTTLTLAAYLTKIETDIEAANASCTVLSGSTSTTSQVATFNNISVSISVAGLDYYVRELNLTISDTVGVKYSVDGEILDPIELTPKMLDLTQEIILGIDSVIANKNAIDAAIANMTTIANAASSASSASASASDALASATASEISAIASSASKDAAALSATNAANTLTAINTVFDDFDDRFLGAKESDPTLDNDGLALSAGAIYFNTVSNNIKFYNGAVWENPQQTATQAAINASNSATSAANSLTSTQAIQTALSNGRTWFFGATQQSAETGIDGDAGFNTATADISRKVAGTWTVVGSLQGRGVSTILRTAGTGAAGTTDTYTITYSDASTSTFSVYNGADGSVGSVGTGDMLKDTYDTTGNGIVDNSEKVNGLTVLTAVPAGALFTDTVYAHPTTTGNKHIPSGGSSNQILRWSSDGTAVWGEDTDTVYTHPATDGSLHVPATGTTNSGKVLTAGGTAGSLSWVTPAATGVTAVSGTAPVVSSGGNTPAISMAAASSGVDGYMTGTYATKLDGIAASANNYSLPTGSSTVIGGTKLFSDVVQSVAANAASTVASRSYGLQLNASGQLVVNVPWTDVDTNTFPTTYEWTAGTTAGPTGSITGTSSTISVGAVPSASATESGIVTTGAQTFAGAKTLTSPVLVTPDIGVATGTSFNSITGLATVAPVADGVASVGSSTLTARQDHVHPSDTTKANQDAATGAVFLGNGTTAQRPILLSTARAIWYNTTLLSFEGWDGTAWAPIGGGSGGATGGGADQVFNLNSYTINNSYTIPAGKSAIVVADANGDIQFSSMDIEITFADTNSRLVVV